MSKIDYEKFTPAQKELWLYAVNEYDIYSSYMDIVSEISARDVYIIKRKDKERMNNIIRLAALKYRSSVGKLGHIGDRQLDAVGMLILEENAIESWNFSHRGF